jgi:hypothetical protein
LERALAHAEQGGREGRTLAFDSLLLEDEAGRRAGLELVVRSASRATALHAPLEQTEAAVAAARGRYLACHVQRQQVQALLEAASKRAQQIERRRVQQQADEVHLQRRARQKVAPCSASEPRSSWKDRGEHGTEAVDFPIANAFPES